MSQQLYKQQGISDIGTVFLLNNFLSGLLCGKEASKIFKNSLPTFVFTLWEKGGLKYVMFRFLFFFLVFMIGSYFNLNS